MRKEDKKVVPRQRGAAQGAGPGRTGETRTADERPTDRIRPTSRIRSASRGRSGGRTRSAHRDHSAEERLRYWFDTTLTRGTAALCGWLALVCLALVVPVSTVLVWTDRHTPASLGSRIAAVWRNTGQTMRLGGEVGPPLRVALSVLLALIALVYVSTLVSLITTGLTDRLIALNRGHARILESGHTVVLGWSEQIPTVLSELVAARTDRRRRTIAVLADRDKPAMEEELRASVGATGRTRVLCRTGRPTDPAALARVSPAAADCVLVLPRDDPRDDTEVVKTLLSLSAAVGETDPVRVVAAVRDDRHLGAARLAAGPGATVLDMDDIAARLLVDCVRQPGLSLVHQELLDFAGHEFHTLREPASSGRTFDEAARACPVSTAVGIVHGDGTVALNPPRSTPLLADDALLVIAEDEHATRLSVTPAPYDPTALTHAPPETPRRPERVLLLGWNRRAPRIATRLAVRTPPGSFLDVVAEPRTDTLTGIRTVTDAVGGRMAVLHRPGDPALSGTTDALDLDRYDAVIVLGPDHRPGHGDPDDRTLVTLLHLRAGRRASGRRVPVVTEMTDDRNRLIAPPLPGADFVVSGRLIGLLMTQISQNPHLAAVFEELLAPDGNTLQLRPAAHYVRTGRTTSFATVAESAARQGACAIGYRSTTAPDHGLCLNPPKAHVRHWHPDDQVVVIAPG
ncbi:NAD-binding lipoprotein [Streptomyces sp. TLI_105]|uniref:CASTOR/POLLUX-related putative ion channel n=1 Tax=Streptomyces sp. TLI_105 TaxID=1881019 RepID=UPI000896BC38|nr:NAD-binding lipoprotein [Streptomyces sp. TLI_105]SEE00162.1 Trk K+ transport system, NAD-binding component [Streptomyces sp. TLI_105]